MKRNQLILLGIATVALVGVMWWSNAQNTPPPPPSGAISRATWGEGWPLTIESGTLDCQRNGSALTITLYTNGVTYAVNGTARDQLPRPAWRDIREIQAPNGDLNALVARGLPLCPK